jgi:PAS domain S-box-containing protein
MAETIITFNTYKSILHKIPEAACLSTLEDGRFIEANDYFCTLLGYDREMIIGRTSFDINIWTDENDRKRFKTALLNNTQGRDCLEFTFRHASGSNIICLLSGRTLEIEGGEYILSILKDITVFRKTMEELTDSRERFRVLHEASFGGISIHDKGIILEANTGLSDLTGYSIDELIGMDGLLLIAPEWRDYVRNRIAEHNEKAYEVEGIRKDNTRYTMRIQGKQIPYHGKSVRVTEFRDITEQKRQEENQRNLEEQMLQIQKMDSIGVLAGGIAHDFNNVLTVISGHAELLLSRLGENNPASRSLTEIHKAAMYAADLTQNLLAFSRKQIYEPKVIDLNSTITGVYKILKRLISEDIKIITTLSSGKMTILADTHQIEQILINLVINARDAIAAVQKPSSQKRIIIETGYFFVDEQFASLHPECSPGNNILLSVSDDGIGMDDQTCSRIFEPFFTTKDPGKGTGLGLSTVYGIVKQNGGFISVYSEPGNGTIFRIYWPLTDETAAAESAPFAEMDLTGTEKILLVEDNEKVCSFTSEVLGSLGYTVITAANGRTALEELDKHNKFDIIITDVIMPEMNGPEFIDSVRKIHPEAIVLFVSGYSENYISQKGILDGNKNFLQKPYSPISLGRKVRELLGRK